MAEKKRIASLSVYSKELGMTGELSLIGSPAQIEKKFGSAALQIGDVTHWGTFNLRETKEAKDTVISLSGFEDTAPIKGGVLFKNTAEDGHTYFAGEFDNQAGEGLRTTGNVMSQDADLQPLGKVVMKKDLAPAAEAEAEEAPAASKPSMM